jgi:hypothetical protein
LSALKAAVVVVENANRQVNRGESLKETFNQTFVRDTSASCYEVGGDPPKELWFCTQDTPRDFLNNVCAGIDMKAIYGDGAHEQTAQYQLDNYVKGMIGMGVIVQQLAETTRTLALDRSQEAGRPPNYPPWLLKRCKAYWGRPRAGASANTRFHSIRVSSKNGKRSESRGRKRSSKRRRSERTQRATRCDPVPN